MFPQVDEISCPATTRVQSPIMRILWEGALGARTHCSSRVDAGSYKGLVATASAFAFAAAVLNSLYLPHSSHPPPLRSTLLAITSHHTPTLILLHFTLTLVLVPAANRWGFD